MSNFSFSTSTVPQNPKLKVLKEKIAQAIEENKKGNKNNYNKLVTNINGLNVNQISEVYIVLNSIVHLLNEDTKELLKVIFTPKTDLWYVEPDEGSAMDVYTKLILSLLTNYPFYLTSFLQVLASNMIDKSGKENLSRIKFRNLHIILKKLNEKIPQCSLILYDLIIRYFPLNGRAFEYFQYTTNLLTMCGYCTAIRNQVLSFIVSKIMTIDVNMSRSQRDTEDDALFELELTGGNSNHENQEKLDITMKICFEYIEKQEEESLFKHMMSIFVKQILQTFNPTTIQFLWFYLCSKKTEYTKQFLDFLIEKSLDTKVHLQIRKNSSNFLGGFLARSNFIKPKKLQLVYDKLIKWMKNYVLEVGKSTIPFDYNHHSHFYSIFNAVLYSLCFKMEEKMILDDLLFIIDSPFCPLSVISQEVTKEFQSKYKQTFKKILKPKATLLNVNTSELIDDFYPFDPYLFPKSSKFIEPLYQSWKPSQENDGSASSTSSLGSKGKTPMSVFSFKSHMSSFVSSLDDSGYSSTTDNDISEKLDTFSFDY